jgi:hypothetical protein
MPGSCVPSAYDETVKLRESDPARWSLTSIAQRGQGPAFAIPELSVRQAIVTLLADRHDLRAVI